LDTFKDNQLIDVDVSKNGNYNGLVYKLSG